MSDEYGGWTVKQLKKELKNRNVKVVGKKEDLIERLASYDQNDNFESSSVEKCDETSVSQILWPPNDTFSSLQVTVPSIDIVHINTYFLKVYKFEGGMSMCSAVHRKGFNMKNNFLLALMESKTDDYIFYHSQVNSEMTKALTYFVKLVLVHDGSIVESTCECIAEKGNRELCVNMLQLFAHALLHSKEHEKLCIRSTCTEKKQIWNMPKKRRLEISPKTSEDLNYSVLEYNVAKKHMNNLCYDPRPACYKNMPS